MRVREVRPPLRLEPMEQGVVEPVRGLEQRQRKILGAVTKAGGSHAPERTLGSRARGCHRSYEWCRPDVMDMGCEGVFHALVEPTGELQPTKTG